MKQIDYYHTLRKKKLSLPHILNPNGEKLFYVFGDSFCIRTDNNYTKSWLKVVAENFNAKIVIYGISGASEHTIFYLYCKLLAHPRELSLIFHTHLSRFDEFFDLNNKLLLQSKFFRKWDALINEPCLHMYWTDHVYKFKNGESVFCDYPKLVDGGDHHMSEKSNKLFAQDIINKINKIIKS